MREVRHSLYQKETAVSKEGKGDRYEDEALELWRGLFNVIFLDFKTIFSGASQ